MMGEIAGGPFCVLDLPALDRGVGKPGRQTPQGSAEGDQIRRFEGLELRALEKLEITGFACDQGAIRLDRTV